MLAPRCRDPTQCLVSSSTVDLVYMGFVHREEGFGGALGCLEEGLGALGTSEGTEDESGGGCF